MSTCASSRGDTSERCYCCHEPEIELKSNLKNRKPQLSSVCGQSPRSSCSVPGWYELQELQRCCRYCWKGTVLLLSLITGNSCTPRNITKLIRDGLPASLTP